MQLPAKASPGPPGVQLLACLQQQHKPCLQLHVDTGRVATNRALAGILLLTLKLTACSLSLLLSSDWGAQVLPEESAALTSQAIEDLTTFLTLRADEFKSGGMLVMSYATLDLTNKK